LFILSSLFLISIKKVSCNDISNAALDKITPVNPPIVNKAKNPIVKINAVVNLKLPPYKVAQGSAFNHYRFS
jgi:hypothetical protein